MAAAVLGAAVLLGAGGGAAWIALRGDEPTARVSPVEKQHTSSQVLGYGGAGSAAVERATDKASGSTTAGYAPSTYVPGDPDYYYLAELPGGPGWSEPVETYPTGGPLLRTTVRGPGGAVVMVDRTPGEVPQLGGDYDSSRVVSQPRFGSATEYVFSTSEYIPECAGAPCVDVLIEDDSGGGWGVLVGGTDVETSRQIAATVSESITDADL